MTVGPQRARRRCVRRPLVDSANHFALDVRLERVRERRGTSVHKARVTSKEELGIGFQSMPLAPDLEAPFEWSRSGRWRRVRERPNL